MTVYEDGPGGANRCLLLDPETAGTGRSWPQAPCSGCSTSPRTSASFSSATGHAAGAALLAADRSTGHGESLLPVPTAGATELGIPAAWRYRGGGGHGGLPGDLMPVIPAWAGGGPGLDGRRAQVGVLGPNSRDDADLEIVDADHDGRTLLLVWNVGGRSEVELIERYGRDRRLVVGVPGTVVDGGVSRDGSRTVLSIESPRQPRRLFRFVVGTGTWAPVTEPSFDGAGLVCPSSERFQSHDGLEVQGWLYLGVVVTRATGAWMARRRQ